MMGPTSHIAVDDSHWPLLIVRLVGSPSLPQYKAFFTLRAEYLERGEKHVGITDARWLKLPPPEFREMQAEWLARHKELMGRTFLGTATLISTAEIRLLKSVSAHQVRALPYPTITVADMGAGVAWAAGRLESAGVQEPAARLRRTFGLGERASSL